MQKRGWGRIVHISGRDGFFVKEHRAHNVSAKAGMHALAKAIALEFGPYGITANTVAPGLMDTVRNMSDYPDFDYMMTQRLPAIPARRIGTGGDIANACLYLCSDGAGFVTGQLLQVNGGEFMY
jgi:3-oxoacyl-[acyl-carrier protein] reductase